ncbi:MAG: ornithine carbamoyltransferase [Bacteroidota bacterium]
MERDLLTLFDVTRSGLEDLFELADDLRLHPGRKPLSGKTVAMIFQKPSLRTRVSFEVGITQLGGTSVFLTQEDIGIGSREPVRDIAKLLSRYTDAVVARLFGHDGIVELARHASIPVINALTDLSHPCQVLADCYTLRRMGRLRENMKVTFVGDGNNIVNSWLELAATFPLRFVLAAPQGYGPDPSTLERAKTAGVSAIDITDDPVAAATGADVLYTDVWVSMGQENEADERRKAFKGFRIDDRLLGRAKPDCLVMHCLPAHRGEEITTEILEGERSIVFDQAENRLHVQKAILTRLMAPPEPEPQGGNGSQHRQVSS